MSGRILAVDYGERRIGLALSDPSRILASPHSTLDTRTCADIPGAIQALVRSEEVSHILVGYPWHLDGRKSEKAFAVDLFMNTLRERMAGIPITPVDERYSSVDAGDRLRQQKRKKGRQPDKGAIDRLSAAIVLQEYLDALPGESPCV